MAHKEATSSTGHGAEDDYDPHRGVLNKIERVLERFIFESRWFLLPIYIGLVVALAMFSMHFVYLVYKFSINIFSYEKNELLFNMLTFVDKALVGGLVIMVIIGGYENSVSMLQIKDQDRKLSWLGKLDASTLKIKLSTSIVSISSVHLLKIFLEVGAHTEKELIWTSLIHFLMVLTAMILTFMDMLSDHGDSKTNGNGNSH